MDTLMHIPIILAQTLPELSPLGDAGVAIAVVAGFVIIARAAFGVMSKWLDVSDRNNKAQNENESKRVANEEKQSDLLQKTTTELMRVSDVLSILADRLDVGNCRTATIQTALDSAVAAMHTTADGHGVLLKAMPQEVRRTLQSDFEQLKKDIPQAVETALEKHTRELRQDIETLSTTLADRVATLSQEIPTKTTLLLRADMAALTAKVTALLKAVEKPETQPEPETNQEQSTDG